MQSILEGGLPDNNDVIEAGNLITGEQDAYQSLSPCYQRALGTLQRNFSAAIGYTAAGIAFAAGGDFDNATVNYNKVSGYLTPANSELEAASGKLDAWTSASPQ
jgi:hypothetical protein